MLLQLGCVLTDQETFEKLLLRGLGTEAAGPSQGTIEVYGAPDRLQRKQAEAEPGQRLLLLSAQDSSLLQSLLSLLEGTKTPPSTKSSVSSSPSCFLSSSSSACQPMVSFQTPSP